MSVSRFRLTGIWRTRAEFKVVPLDQGNYLFRFDDLEDRLGVLMGGPWFVGHHRLRLRLWDIDFDPADEKISHVPIWIRLQNLPLKFWQNDIILKIVAAVGRPLKLDTFTATKQSGSFARICVEMDLDKPLTRGVMLKSSTKSQWQSILYEDVPEICSFCMFAGHTIKMCKRKAEEMIITQQVEITGENQPQSSANSAKEEENPWSVAVRTRRRSRRPVKEGGRKNITGNSSAGQGEEGGPLQQLRKETKDLGKPSHVNPLSKEKLAEHEDVKHEKRPRIMKEGSGKVAKIGKSCANVGIAIPQGNKFDALAVHEENMPHMIPLFKEIIFDHQTEPAHPNQARTKASQAQLSIGSPILNKQTNPSPTQPSNHPILNRQLPSFPPTQLGKPSKTFSQRLPPKPSSYPPEVTTTNPGNPIQMAPLEKTHYSRTSLAYLALISAPVRDGNLVVDISPSQPVEHTGDDSLGLVIYDPSSSETVKAKATRLEKMELCRLSGTKTKVDDQFEAFFNSSDPVRQKKASKLAKTNTDW